jgi:hypothetical protein
MKKMNSSNNGVYLSDNGVYLGDKTPVSWPSFLT